MPTVVDPERKQILDAERAKWLTVEEAAHVLKTSKDTLLKAIYEGHIELFAPGNVWRIHIDSLQKCQKAISEWQ